MLSPDPAISALSATPTLACALSVLAFLLYGTLVLKVVLPEIATLFRSLSTLDRTLIFTLILCTFVASVRGFSGELAVVPDAVEYGVSALNWVKDGAYGFWIDGVLHPPRYPPFLSLVLVAPWMVLLPSLKVAIAPILLHALLVVIVAACIARRLGTAATALAPALTLSAPLMLYHSGEVVTQIPAVAITLLALMLFLNSYEKSLETVAVPAGALIFCGALLRPLLLVLLLPFIIRALTNRQHLKSLYSLVGFGILAVLTHLVYNRAVFGDAFRSGYNYWCSIPYDYSSLTFSSQYFGTNLRFLSDNGASTYFLVMLLIACGSLYAVLRSSRSSLAAQGKIQSYFLPTLYFILAGVLPVSIIHLFYFFPAVGFQLPLLACVATVAGGALNLLLAPEERRSWRVALGGGLVLIVVLGVVAVFVWARSLKPSRFEIASALAKHVASGDTVISALDPVYLSIFLPQGVKIVPISRRVEYASKFYTPRHLTGSVSPTSKWSDHRNPALSGLGAKEAVSAVLIDQDGIAVSQASSVGATWVETGFFNSEERTKVKEALVLDQIEDTLFKVKQGAPSPF